MGQRRPKGLRVDSSRLLFIVVILSIAAVLVFSALGNWRRDGRDARREADINRIATAMELYFNLHVRYPQSHVMPESVPGFLPSVPEDPRGGYVWADNSVTGPNTSQDYCVSAQLEKETESGKTVYVVAGPNGVKKRELTSSYVFDLEDCE